MRLWPLVALLAGAATAQEAPTDYVVADGKLDEAAFHALVACGAPPGEACPWPEARWPAERARDLRVSLRPPHAGWTAAEIATAERAIDAAIAEINAAGAALAMRRVGKGEAHDIAVHLVAAGGGEVIAGTWWPWLDGAVMQGGMVSLRWGGEGRVNGAAIAIASDLPAREMTSILLEELTQATGLTFDIRDPAYDDVSIFAEDSNSVLRLGYADRAALRRHYPPDLNSASAP